MTAVVSLIAGTMFLMWLGEQITERGIGNGISLIIFAGIVSGLPAAIVGTLELVRNGDMNAAAGPDRCSAMVVARDVLRRVRRARPAPDHGQLRQAPAGVAAVREPELAPAAQAEHVGRDPADLRVEPDAVPGHDRDLVRPRRAASSWLQSVAPALTPGQPLHMILYGGLIICFAFFYTALVFNSQETAENLKKSGALIPGIRPGKQTGEYIDGVLTRLTVWGALYLVLVCLLPEFLIPRFSVPFYFGGTSLLIVVVVVMDFQAQIQAHLMSHQYEGLMKKANLRGYGRSGQTQ